MLEMVDLIEMGYYSYYPEAVVEVEESGRTESTATDQW